MRVDRRRRGRAIRRARRAVVDRRASAFTVELFLEASSFQDRINEVCAKLSAISDVPMDQLADAMRAFAIAVREPIARPPRQLLHNGRAPRRGRR